MNQKIKFLLLILSFTFLAGASRCKPDKPLSVTGHWNIKCSDDTEPVELMKLYVSDAVSFLENKSFKEYHSYGTYTKLVTDAFYKLEETKLDILDSQNQLLVTFDVKRIADDELEISNSIRVCQLKTIPEPQVLTGRHPVWTNGALDLDVRIDGVPTISQVSLRVSNFYQSPQIFKQVTLSPKYELHVATLHVSGTGENPGDYAWKVMLVKTGITTPVDMTTETPIVLNETGELSYTEGNSEIVVSFRAVQL